MDLQGTYILIGPPGTGKTRFLAERTARIVDQHTGFGGAKLYGKQGNSPVLISSLTRTAASEIASRTELPKEAVATIHAHAYRSQGCPKLLNSKLISDEWNKTHPAYALTPDEKSADNADDLLNPTQDAPGDPLLSQYNLLRNQMTPRDLYPYEISYFVRKYEEFKRDTDTIDYTDMLEKADDAPPCNPQVLIVDEAQDTSRLAFSVIQKWSKHTKATIIVGDPWQALYTWAGADPTILTDNSIDTSHRGILKQSYRVPQKVHNFAINWIKQLSDYQPIEYLPRKEELSENSPTAIGDVTQINATWQFPGPAIQHALDYASQGLSVMLITSCNYMTSAIVRELRSQYIPFSNPWRLANGRWNPYGPKKGITTLDRLETFLKPIWNDNNFSSWTLEDVHIWSEFFCKEVFAIYGGKAAIERMAKENPKKPLEPQDLIACFSEDFVSIIVPMFQKQDVQGLLSLWHSKVIKSKKTTTEFQVVSAQLARDRSHFFPWENFFSYIRENKIFVGTAHSFKGAEADVVIVFPDLSYKAYENMICGQDFHRDSIIRTFYVAFTRARHKLILCDPAGPNFVSWWR